MSAYTEHENDLSRAHRYKKYAGAYNETFVADPDPANRKFNELAPKDSKQWERLEIYRGNDKDAYYEHQDHPHLAPPTAKETKMWEVNRAQRWDIDRQPNEPVEHRLSHNKWLPPMGADKEKINAYFEKVEATHGPNYDAYVKQAGRDGNHAVAKDDYLRTMSVVDYENRGASQQRSQAQAVQPQEQPQSAPRSRLSVGELQEPAASQAAEPAPAGKSRISLAEFQGTPEEYIQQRTQVMERLPDAQLVEVMKQADIAHQAMGEGPIKDAGAKVEALNQYHAQEAQRGQTQAQQEVASQSMAQQRARDRDLQR